jgi:hypothetical protein
MDLTCFGFNWMDVVWAWISVGTKPKQIGLDWIQTPGYTKIRWIHPYPLSCLSRRQLACRDSFAYTIRDNGDLSNVTARQGCRWSQTYSSKHRVKVKPFMDIGKDVDRVKAFISLPGMELHRSGSTRATPSDRELR